MKKILTILAMFATMVANAAGVMWQNVDDDHHLGGRKASEGYLQGKIVLVCQDSGMATRMETIWQSFKTKPFVILGAFEKPVTGCSFSMYRSAGLASGAPGAPLYLVSETGKVIYKGSDDRHATEVLVTAITDQESPKNVAQWKALLDFELETLPGRAYLRLDEFRKKYPQEARSYLKQAKDLFSIPEIKKLAELVDMARKSKDAPEFGPKKQAQKQRYVIGVKNALKKYESLKNAQDARVAQEAKNSLADLKWALASQK